MALAHNAPPASWPRWGYERALRKLCETPLGPSIVPAPLSTQSSASRSLSPPIRPVFESPEEAIRFADSFRTELLGEGLDIGAGMHAGEVVDSQPAGHP